MYEIASFELSGILGTNLMFHHDQLYLTKSESEVIGHLEDTERF